MPHQKFVKEPDLIKNTLIGIENRLNEIAGDTYEEYADWPGLSKILIDENLGILSLPASGTAVSDLNLHIHPQLVMLIFALRGHINIRFPRMEQPVLLEKGNSIFISHPYAPLVAELAMESGTEAVFLLTTIERMHHFFNANLDMSTMTREELSRYYDPQKLYLVKPLSGNLSVSLHQVIQYNLGSHFRNMYMNGKVLEIFSIYFSNAATDDDAELDCPFLDNPDDIKCIRKAKQILLDNMTDAPTISQLAKQAGINEFKLKNGFKDIYGNTIYGYLNEHRMQQAILLLEQRSYTINEVAYAIGYGKPSNFIAAFKKKYGVTPKKYELELRD